MPPSIGGRWLAKRDGRSSPPPQRYTINFKIPKEFTLLFQTMQEFLHPQSIVQITTIAIPATARRVEECKAFFKVRFRTSSSRPTWCGNSSPATMSWVDIVARKAIAIRHKPHRLRTNRGLVGLHGKHQPFHIAERKATRHQPQLLNQPLRTER